MHLVFKTNFSKTFSFLFTKPKVVQCMIMEDKYTKVASSQKQSVKVELKKKNYPLTKGKLNTKLEEKRVKVASLFWAPSNGNTRKQGAKFMLLLLLLVSWPDHQGRRKLFCFLSLGVGVAECVWEKRELECKSQNGIQNVKLCGGGCGTQGRGKVVDSTCPLVGMWSDICIVRCHRARV